jgi:hypothetical protein
MGRDHPSVNRVDRPGPGVTGPSSVEARRSATAAGPGRRFWVRLHLIAWLGRPGRFRPRWAVQSGWIGHRFCGHSTTGQGAMIDPIDPEIEVRARFWLPRTCIRDRIEYAEFQS